LRKSKKPARGQADATSRQVGKRRLADSISRVELGIVEEIEWNSREITVLLNVIECNLLNC
jgi:hypothetical protein